MLHSLSAIHWCSLYGRHAIWRRHTDYSPSTIHRCSLYGSRACRGCIAGSLHFQNPPDRSDTACFLLLWPQLQHWEIWTSVWEAGWVGPPRFPDAGLRPVSPLVPTVPVCKKCAGIVMVCTGLVLQNSPTGFVLQNSHMICTSKFPHRICTSKFPNCSLANIICTLSFK